MVYQEMTIYFHPINCQTLIGDEMTSKSHQHLIVFVILYSILSLAHITCNCQELKHISYTNIREAGDRVLGDDVGDDDDILKYVDPFISTGGVGFGIGSNPPGPQVPFGMVRLSPDTVNIENIFLEFNHFGGYYHSDDFIRTFSHTHMVGPGLLDYGNIGVMAVTRNRKEFLSNHDHFLNHYKYKSHFSHEHEFATAGYYQVRLLRYGINAEMTSTKYCGVHRYTFDIDQMKKRNEQEFLLFDVSHTLVPGACKESSLYINNTDQSISGYVLNSGQMSSRFGGVKIYFYSKINVPFKDFGIWNDGVVTEGAFSTNGTSIGAFVSSFLSTTDHVTVYVAISFISIDQAKRNFIHELALHQNGRIGKSFDQIKEDTQNIWRDHLSIVQINDIDSEIALKSTGSSKDRSEDKVKFYTAMYHALLSPTTFSEVGGVFLGFDNQVHQIRNDQKSYYTDMSIWDIHRTQIPMLSLLFPQVMHDIVLSLLQMYEIGGALPRWPFSRYDTQSMIGSHSIIMIVDAIVKGIQFDDVTIQLAVKAMKQAATQHQIYATRTAIDEYLEKGYVSLESSKTSACLTIEYAYDDYILGSFLKNTMNDSESGIFIERGKNYRHVFDSKNQFFCPRSKDNTTLSFDCPSGLDWINVFDSRYVEGDAWHYRFFAPHDVDGLIALFSSKEDFVQQLDKFMSWAHYYPINAAPNPYYWSGNEHDLFSCWMFNWAGRPDKTQYHSRWIMEHKYTTKPDGIPGNDDYGTMSAWFVFASLGFYPLSGTTIYPTSTPLFSNITLHISDDCIIKIISHCADSKEHKDCIYVKQMKVNGQVMDKPFLDHSKHLLPSSCLQRDPGHIRDPSKQTQLYHRDFKMHRESKTTIIEFQTSKSPQLD